MTNTSARWALMTASLRPFSRKPPRDPVRGEFVAQDGVGVRHFAVHDRGPAAVEQDPGERLPLGFVARGPHRGGGEE
ncbi:hypothetical protein NKH18_02020 [Streptomyces sp. M10(2022)]